jgi:uncharacterized membrane protein
LPSHGTADTLLKDRLRVKIILVILIVVGLYFAWLAIQPFRRYTASYKTTVSEELPDGSIKKISESPWMQSTTTEQQQRSFFWRFKIVICFLLALDIIGVVYVIQRLRAKAYQSDAANAG